MAQELHVLISVFFVCSITIDSISDTEEGQTQLEEVMSMKKKPQFSDTLLEGAGEYEDITEYNHH